MEDSLSTPAVKTLCTEVCGSSLMAKSCSKICLVKVYPKGHHENAVRMHAMLDDQSNRSLARSRFFDLFSIHNDTFPYTLKTCAGMRESSGRRVTGYEIEALNGGVSLTLPTLNATTYQTIVKKSQHQRPLFITPTLRALLLRFQLLINKSTSFFCWGETFLELTK